MNVFAVGFGNIGGGVVLVAGFDLVKQIAQKSGVALAVKGFREHGADLILGLLLIHGVNFSKGRCLYQ